MTPAGRSPAAPPSRSRKVKVQDPDTVGSSGTGATATGGTQKILLPKVRYHPTILMQSAGDGGRAKTTSQTQKTRPDVVHPKHTGEAHERKSKSSQVNPVSAVRSQEQNQNAPVQKPVLKPVQFTAADPDAPQTPDQISQLNKSGAAAGGAAPRPEEVPLGLGVRLERRVVEEVELRTRGQRENPAWFAWRLNRITASAAHRIAHCRFVSGTSQTPPASYLAAITGEGPRVQTRAMSWGIQREEEAVRRYQVLKSRALGRDVTVRDCGLFIDTKRSWLAASPDGIVTDSRTGQWLLCLEVKCPYKHRERSVEEACRDDRAFCLEIQGGGGGGGGGTAASQASSVPPEAGSQLLHSDPVSAGGERPAAGRPGGVHPEGDGHRTGDLRPGLLGGDGVQAGGFLQGRPPASPPRAETPGRAGRDAGAVESG